MQLHSLLSQQISLSLLLLVLPVLTNAANIAAYWGQNAGGSQQSLASYCSSSAADIIILSFMNNFPQLGLNFANQCSQTFSDGLLDCPQIGADITTCQGQGKIILLSLGGESGTYGFSSDSEAQSFATTMWNKFGGGTDDERPFGDAIIDGFDFDIENKQQTGYVALATQLKSYFASSSRQYYLSAAPQCPYPDESVGDLMALVDLDFAFIQFYNNYCSIDKQFNWDTWSQYASGKNIKLYLGVPGSASSAGSGYVDASTIASTIAQIQGDSAFGGVSVWDISSAPTSFLSQIKNALSGGSSVSSAAVSVPAASLSTLSTVSSNYNPYTSLVVTPTYSAVQSSGVAATIVGSSTPTATTTSSTGGFWSWIGDLFAESSSSPSSPSSSTATAAAVVPVASTVPVVVAQPTASSTPVAAVPTTTSSFNWFGLFDSPTTPTTQAPAITSSAISQGAQVVEVTRYVTLTTTVAPTRFYKRQVQSVDAVDSSASHFHPGYLLIVGLLTALSYL